MADLRYLARYPFLKEASSYIRECGPSLEQLLEGREWSRVRKLGLERVMGALEDEAIPVYPTATEAECLSQILSYPIARIIVSAVNDPFLTRRYALAEAERANAMIDENESADTAINIAKKLGIDVSIAKCDTGKKEMPVLKKRPGVSQQRKGANAQPALATSQEKASIQFCDYLRYSSSMRGGMRGEWKLASQSLSQGYVSISIGRLLRLIQQAVQMKIESELPLGIDKKVALKFREETSAIKQKVEAHRKTYSTEDIGRLSVINLPPCMRKLLSMAQAGQNIPHQGRFALTAFLHTLGMGADEIIKQFSLSPDFDPKKSRYQVEHITGVISSTAYTPPECSTMRTYNICFDPDELCKKEWMTHPLKYYRAKTKRRYKPEPSEKASGRGKSKQQPEIAEKQSNTQEKSSGSKPA